MKTAETSECYEMGRRAYVRATEENRSIVPAQCADLMATLAGAPQGSALPRIEQWSKGYATAKATFDAKENPIEKFLKTD